MSPPIKTFRRKKESPRCPHQSKHFAEKKCPRCPRQSKNFTEKKCLRGLPTNKTNWQKKCLGGVTANQKISPKKSVSEGSPPILQEIDFHQINLNCLVAAWESLAPLWAPSNLEQSYKETKFFLPNSRFFCTEVLFL